MARKVFKTVHLQRLYEFLMKKPPARGNRRTTGNLIYEAFWKGFDGVPFSYMTRWTFRHAAWRAGKDYRKTEGRDRGRQPIPWDELVVMYNEMNGTKFRTVKEMLSCVYRKKKSMKKLGKVFGVSDGTVLQKLHAMGCKVQGRGGPNNVGPLKSKDKEIAELWKMIRNSEKESSVSS